VNRQDSIDTGMVFALRYWQAAETFVVFEAKPWLCQGLSQIWANGSSRLSGNAVPKKKLPKENG
jgi:hypothetical protein